MAGLSSIYGLANAVGEINRDLYPVYTRKAIEDNQAEIVALNVSQLYDEGMTRLGVKIWDYAPYTPYTQRLKQELGQPYDRVTLRDTGAFHESFAIRADQGGFDIVASDPKTEMLVGKYGPEIFGLTEQNLSYVATWIVYPDVMKQIRLKIYGTT